MTGLVACLRQMTHLCAHQQTPAVVPSSSLPVLLREPYALKFILASLITRTYSLITVVTAPVPSDTGEAGWGHRYAVVEASEELEREGDRDDLDDELDHRHPQDKLRCANRRECVVFPLVLQFL